MSKVLITVKSSRAAIRIDNFCSEAGIRSKTIPTPENISSECGISLVVDRTDLDRVDIFMISNNLEYHIYDRPSEI